MNAMTLAWKIARKAAVKFNDKPSVFFVESLKKAWKMIKQKELQPVVFLLKDINVNQYYGLLRYSTKWIGEAMTMKADNIEQARKLAEDKSCDFRQWVVVDTYGNEI